MDEPTKGSGNACVKISMEILGVQVLQARIGAKFWQERGS